MLSSEYPTQARSCTRRRSSRTIPSAVADAPSAEPISSTTTFATSARVSAFESAAVMCWSRSERRRKTSSASKSRLRSRACAHCETDRLQPSALVVRELPRTAEGDVQRAAHPGRRAKRDRHPSLILEIADVEARHLARVRAQTGSPAAIARANGTFESSANVPQCRSSSSEYPELDTKSTVTPSGCESTTNPASASTASRTWVEARVGDLGRRRCEGERRGDLLQPARLVGALRRLGLERACARSARGRSLPGPRSAVGARPSRDPAPRSPSSTRR